MLTKSGAKLLDFGLAKLVARPAEAGHYVRDDRSVRLHESNSSGRFEVYVRPFPNVGDGQWQISTGDGVQALWARNGRELFYLTDDGALMTVPVTTGSGSWSAGTPTRVLTGAYYEASPTSVVNTMSRPMGSVFS